MCVARARVCVCVCVYVCVSRVVFFRHDGSIGRVFVFVVVCLVFAVFCKD